MQSLRLWQKKKSVTSRQKKRDVGVIAWTLERERFLPPTPAPPSLPLVHHLFYTSWHEALGTPFLIGLSLPLLPLQRLQPFNFQSTELIYISNPNDDKKSLYFTPLSM